MTTIKNKPIIYRVNTKKADWNHKVRFKDITLHSFKWDNKEKTYAFFTIGENEEISLSYKADKAKCSFMLFHTPNDHIEFSDNIDISLFGAELTIKKEIGDNITLKKIGESLEFYSAGELVLKTSNPAFSPSATLSFIADGEGEVYLEVF